MNREIKFRAWLRESEGFNDEGYKMIDDLAFEEYLPVNDQLASVKYLMQFTGLKDKNGKEIYEGDKLNGLHGFTWVVSWNDNHACFQVTSGNVVAEVIDNDNMEVIGNIYQKPELLETVKK